MSLSLYYIDRAHEARDGCRLRAAEVKAPLSETPTVSVFGAPMIGVLHVQASHRDAKDVKNNPLMNLASFSLSNSGTQLSVKRQLYSKRLAAK